MTAGAFVPGREVRSDRTLTPDACVVGSGAGGAVLAARLAEAGLSVVVLEAGGYHTRAEFDMQEETAYPMLYQEDGGRATVDRAVAILQGRCVGGSTVVNWTTTFRTPARILKHWAKHHGVDTLTPEVLLPHFEAVEKRLSIHQWPMDEVNRNNDILWRGCEKLGWRKALLRRNVHGCLSSGYCGMGCPVDAKQAMHITYLADAVAKGTVVHADCEVVRIEARGRKATGVHGAILDPKTKRPAGPRITVKPKVVAVCGGALNTPALLLRSGLDRNGRTGKRTFIHPVVAMGATYDEPIEAYYGAPQSVHSHEFIDRGPGRLGIFIEAAPLHPMLAAISMGGFGRAHEKQMEDLPKAGSLIALAVDGLLPQETGGTVTAGPAGEPRLDYPLTPLHMEAFRAAMKALARIHFAAGANEVSTLHDPPVFLHSDADLGAIDRAPFAPLRFPVFTAHLMGGASMGGSPATSVVDPHLKHHAFDNLFVVDGSVLPTALGVNPSETLYAISHWAAPGVAKAV